MNMRSIRHLMIAALSSHLLFGSQIATAQAKNAELVIGIEHVVTSRISSAYQVAVFSDGTVVYDGLGNVKTLGKVEYKISEGATARLRQLIAAAPLIEWSSRSDKKSPVHQRYVRIWYPVNGKSISLDYFGPLPPTEFITFLSNVEAELRTRELRCPYVLKGFDDNLDICALRSDTTIDKEIGSAEGRR